MDSFEGIVLPEMGLTTSLEELMAMQKLLLHGRELFVSVFLPFATEQKTWKEKHYKRCCERARHEYGIATKKWIQNHIS